MSRPAWPRWLAAVLAVLALLALLPALLASYGGYEAQGRFSSSGCSGDIADAEYHLRHSTRTLRDSGVGIGCPTTVHIDYSELAADDNPVTRQRNPGVGELAQAFPILVTGAALAVLAAPAAVLAMHRGRPLAFLAAGLALLAVLGLVGGAVLMQVGIGKQVEWETTAAQGDLRDDPDAFSWGPGLYAAYGNGVLLVGAAGLLFVPVRAGRPEEEGEGADPGEEPEGPQERPTGAQEDPDDARPDAQAPQRTPAAQGPAAHAEEEGAPHPATAGHGEDEGRQAPGPGEEPRRLRCPDCGHRFLGQWGVKPTCPECGFQRG